MAGSSEWLVCCSLGGEGSARLRLLLIPRPLYVIPTAAEGYDRTHIYHRLTTDYTSNWHLESLPAWEERKAGEAWRPDYSLLNGQVPRRRSG